MKKGVMLLMAGALCLFTVISCNTKPGGAERESRLNKLMAIQHKLLADEQVFFNVLDSVNKLRETPSDNHDSLHTSAIAGLSSSYNVFGQQVYDALGQAAAVANSGSDAATDATSVYLLSVRTLVEQKYAELVNLSSLRLDSYGETEFATYTRLLQEITAERQALESDLRAAITEYVKENKIETKAD